MFIGKFKDVQCPLVDSIATSPSAECMSVTAGWDCGLFQVEPRARNHHSPLTSKVHQQSIKYPEFPLPFPG
jgi:hypothetical protein